LLRKVRESYKTAAIANTRKISLEIRWTAEIDSVARVFIIGVIEDI